MLEFKVTDMSCNHCVQTITKAALAVDPQAKVNIDLHSKTVQIASATAADTFRQAIMDAGYSVE